MHYQRYFLIVSDWVKTEYGIMFWLDITYNVRNKTLFCYVIFIIVQTIEMLSHYEENVINYLYLKRLLVVYRMLKAQPCAGKSYDIINDEIYDLRWTYQIFVSKWLRLKVSFSMNCRICKLGIRLALYEYL